MTGGIRKNGVTTARSILLDGIGRSGTSLLGRLMERILAPRGFVYYYEPFHHPSPAGRFEGWREMIAELPRAGGEDDAPSLVALQGYMDSMTASAPKLVWKEIRLALKQRMLLEARPELRIVHTTRDIMGVLSSHYREGASDWMPGHRAIWAECLLRWMEQPERLDALGVRPGLSAGAVRAMSETEKYSLVWGMNERFCLGIDHPRFMRIRYEDLCEKPFETLNGVAEFIGIELTDADRKVAREHLEQSGIEFDPSGAGTGLPSAEMPGIWRARLSPAVIAEIEGAAGEVRRLAGYPPVGADPPGA